ncbi:hypothetical protein BVX99_02680 [bacterium F16]|nr:hypothetical protein BVX99_02680 [bacterium F16]
MKYCCILMSLFFLCRCCAQDIRRQLTSGSFAYILQADGLGDRAKALKQLTTCKRSTLIIDYSFDGTHKHRWTVDEIIQLKRTHIVLAYMSIGEAERYRYYWNSQWDLDNNGVPDEAAPTFLCSENPDWGGNYRVKYWQKEWQKLIVNYLAFIQAQGFDGVYLDIIDAFEGFELDNGTWVDDRINQETGNSYRKDMIKWVSAIAKNARETQKTFLIVPQNGLQLLDHPEYLDVISGVGVESLFAEGNVKRPQEEIADRLKYLDNAKAKPVLSTDYSTDKRLKRWVWKQAQANSFSQLITKRELDALGETHPRKLR